jgi:hypothetical protein
VVVLPVRTMPWTGHAKREGESYLNCTHVAIGREGSCPIAAPFLPAANIRRNRPFTGHRNLHLPEKHPRPLAGLHISLFSFIPIIHPSRNKRPTRGNATPGLIKRYLTLLALLPSHLLSFLFTHHYHPQYHLTLRLCLRVEPRHSPLASLQPPLSPLSSFSGAGLPTSHLSQSLLGFRSL